MLAAAVGDLTGDGAGALGVATRIRTRVHGVVDLELSGHLAALVVAVDELYAAEIEAALAMIVPGPTGPDALR